MQILSGFFTIFLGVFFIWLGSFQLLSSMVPKDIGIKFAEAHGSWMREHVFRLPPPK